MSCFSDVKSVAQPVAIRSIARVESRSRSRTMCPPTIFRVCAGSRELWGFRRTARLGKMSVAGEVGRIGGREQMAAGGRSDLSALVPEEGWPCQRLRIAFSLILFFFFETLIGKQLGFVIAVLALGIGIACLASAMQAIQRWKLGAQLALIREAFDQRPRF